MANEAPVSARSTPHAGQQDPNPAQPLYLPLLEGEVLRLVDLAPGTADQPVSIRLLIAELGYHPEYEAVSYVWGDAHQTTPILCNGRPLDITVSLDAVFRRVRFPDRSRLLWADAVCINQRHDDERSHHVSFMGKVYRCAKRVLVYFGNDSDGGAQDVSALVREYAQLISRYKSVHEMPVLSADDPALDDGRWKSLATFHRLPWFRRAWVLQEVGLAQDPICLYGDEEFDYRDLMRLAVWTMRCAPHLDPRHGISFFTVHTDWLDWSPDWQATSPDPSQTLLGLLNHSRWLSCRMKKDHIYALLGHPLARVDAGEEPIVQPSYRRTDEEVFLELGKILIRDHGLRGLSPIEHNEETWNSSSVPSWVPFYHDVELTACNFGVFPDFWYDAAAGTEAQAPIFLDDKNLLVRGYQVDTVKRVMKFSDSDLEDLGSLNTFKSDAAALGPGLGNPTPRQDDRLLSRIMDAALSLQGEDDENENSQAYAHPHDRVTAVSLTLCAGLSRYRCAADDLQQHRTDFAAYCERYEYGYGYASQRQQHLSSPSGEPTVAVAAAVAARGDSEKFLTDMKLVCDGRTFVFTEAGRFGLGPMIASPGDVCCVFFGGSVPFILREKVDQEEKGHYKLLGEAYLHGLMRGEAFEGPRRTTSGESFVIC